jgi:multidrug efflux pump subunit AcrA (membrane-fusion protein)
MPAVTRAVALMILATLAITAAVLYLAPWVQTVTGRGVVTALDPQDRQQAVHALVGGRIEAWFVREGSRVEQGDPIVRLVDNDPQLLQRLEQERAAVRRKVEAAETQAETAVLDYERQQKLHAEGLASRRKMENARIELEDLRSKLAAARAELEQVEIKLNRQATQTVVAPRDGTILDVAGGASATWVRQGDRVATFVPRDVQRAVQLYLDGRDAALVEEGRDVRLQFEGWPAVQFSGWPSVAVGTFGGKVAVVNRGASPGGMFRVMVVPDPEEPPWPEERFVRLGTQAQGWILLDTVKLGYELWRQMNNFPPNFQVPGQPGAEGGSTTDRKQ